MAQQKSIANSIHKKCLNKNAPVLSDFTLKAPFIQENAYINKGHAVNAL